MNSRSSTPAFGYSSSYSLCHNEKRECYGSAACLMDPDEMLFRKTKLTRHNSMKIIRKHEYVPRPHMGARSLSFRLSKCNSLFDSDKEFSDEETVVESSTQTDGETQTDETNKRKKRWFSRRWFSFRRLIPPRKAPQTTRPLPPGACYNDSSSGYSSESPRRQPRCASPASSVSAIYASIGNRTATNYSRDNNNNNNCSKTPDSNNRNTLPINKFDKYGDIEQRVNGINSD